MNLEIWVLCDYLEFCSLFSIQKITKWPPLPRVCSFMCVYLVSHEFFSLSLVKSYLCLCL